MKEKKEFEKVNYAKLIPAVVTFAIGIYLIINAIG